MRRREGLDSPRRALWRVRAVDAATGETLTWGEALVEKVEGLAVDDLYVEADAGVRFEMVRMDEYRRGDPGCDFCNDRPAVAEFERGVAICAACLDELTDGGTERVDGGDGSLLFCPDCALRFPYDELCESGRCPDCEADAFEDSRASSEDNRFESRRLGE